MVGEPYLPAFTSECRRLISWRCALSSALRESSAAPFLLSAAACLTAAPLLLTC